LKQTFIIIILVIFLTLERFTDIPAMKEISFLIFGALLIMAILTKIKRKIRNKIKKNAEKTPYLFYIILSIIHTAPRC
jgi:hypothetical protein